MAEEVILHDVLQLAYNLARLFGKSVYVSSSSSTLRIGDVCSARRVVLTDRLSSKRKYHLTSWNLFTVFSKFQQVISGNFIEQSNELFKYMAVLAP